jgi:hypothetical protein
MSEVAEAATVRILLADFANADPARKLNIIGGGISLIGFDANLKATMPYAVVARIAFPPKFVGESPAVELALEHEDGTPVALPGPMGSQLLRVGSADALKPAVIPNADVPPNVLWPNVSFAMHFSNGLPLEPHKVYTWRVKIDHYTRAEWTETFYVFTPSPGAVIG